MNILAASFKNVVLTVAIVMGIFGLGQAQDGRSRLESGCVSLKMIEQKPAPKSNEKPAPDVIVTIPDDYHIVFELKNLCREPIYYLAYDVPDLNKAPAGFMIYRNKKNNWEARSPAWRREGSLTGIWYHWVRLNPTERVEFEYSDLSRITGERSVAIYVNSCPVQEKRVEIIGTPFSLKK